MDYKKEEIKEYFNDYIEENKEYLEENKHWKDDLHHHAFNEDYYIIGTYSHSLYCFRHGPANNGELSCCCSFNVPRCR